MNVYISAISIGAAIPLILVEIIKINFLGQSFNFFYFLGTWIFAILMAVIVMWFFKKEKNQTIRFL